MNYEPTTAADRQAMLDALGIASPAELFRDIPAHLRQPPLDLPPKLSEIETTRLLSSLAARNADLTQYACFLGAGAYNHYIPSAVAPLLSRGEFLTSYTPYQPEVSQGTLQAAYEFQTMVCQLLGMDVANASMYDGASALAEAVLLALRVTRRSAIAVAPTLHPDWLQVLETYLAALDVEVRRPPLSDPTDGRLDAEWLAQVVDDRTACVVVQQPNFLGCVERPALAAEAAHRHGALLVMACDPIALGVLRPPGAYGADVAVAEGQPLGLPVAFGGPWVGFFACQERYLRQMPGRIVGQTVDHNGRRAFVLTLQAREQHIRREKATSNICTSQQLCALATTITMGLLGPQGLRRMAEQCTQKAHYAAERIAALPGYELALQAPFFKEFVVRCPRPVAEINAALEAERIIGGLDLERFYPEMRRCMLLCVTEMNTRTEIDRLVEVLSR
jgi:glycine dehydrogenase subunit 1